LKTRHHSTAAGADRGQETEAGVMVKRRRHPGGGPDRERSADGLHAFAL